MNEITIDKMKCPRADCDGTEIKDNGYGFYRCRKCDVEFRINYNPHCKHRYKKHEHCERCGEEHMEGNPHHIFG